MIIAPLLALLAAVQADPCPPAAPPRVQFAPGEQLRFRLDLLGADVGAFDLSLEPAPVAERKRAAFAVRSRARTSAFVSTNVGRYEAFATSLLASDLTPLHYREELDEGQVHKTIDVDFPPKDGELAVVATKDGNPDPIELAAGPTARDILSTLYLLRGQALDRPVCVDVYAGRKVWRLEGKMAGREQIETPLGKFASLRFDGTATRLDDPSVKRSAHVWVSDDARRLPLVAIGEVKGKVIRAQLIEATGAPRATASRKDPAPSAPRVGASIGR